MPNLSKLRLPAALLLGTTLALGVLVGFVAPAGADKQGDVFLSPGQSFSYTSKRPMYAPPPAVVTAPPGCAASGTSGTCDAFKIVVNRDTTEGATNFIVARLSWDGGFDTPPIITPAAGVTAGDAIDYDLYVWTVDEKNVYTRDATPDGGLANPELIGFAATRDEYFITVQNVQGASLGYTFSVDFSNERFLSPFESLDPAFAGAAGPSRPVESFEEAPVDSSGIEPTDAFDFAAPFAPGAAGVVDIRPVEADSDFAGFQGGVDDALAGNLAAFTPGERALPDLGPSPSVAVLLFWLVAVPLGIAAALVVLIRRRSPAAAV